jgi:hypothetical protein
MKLEVVHDAKMVVCTVVLWDQYSSVHMFELLSLLKVVLKGECCFCCYKLCGTTQVWDECVTSSNTAWTYV